MSYSQWRAQQQRMNQTTPSPQKRKRNETSTVIDLTQSPPSTPKKSTPRKRQKTTDGEELTPSPEKRAKRYREHAPQDVMVKYDRVMTQRMFLVERSGRKDGELHEDFSVLGSTGNVYNVNLSQIPTCTCPDFAKHQVHCKHILFVLVKVLKLPNPLWFQAAFLTQELEEIFKKVEDSRHSVSDRVLKHYTSLKNGETIEMVEESTNRKPLEGDCPICFEDLSESSLDNTVYCKAMCGNNIHKECFNQWARSKQQERSEVTCVYCRSKWDDGRGKDKQVSTGYYESDEEDNEGYVNLAQVAGLSSVRDTSTYHYASWGSGKNRRRYY